MYVEKKLRKLLMDWWIVPLAFSSSKLLDMSSGYTSWASMLSLLSR